MEMSCVGTTVLTEPGDTNWGRDLPSAELSGSGQVGRQRVDGEIANTWRSGQLLDLRCPYGARCVAFERLGCLLSTLG